MGKEINRLKAVLAEVGKTNVWLAEQLGVNPTTVSKWCTITNKNNKMDYIDKYSINVCTKKQITAQEVYDMIFSDYPPLVRLLFNIRNKIVKRFGLKASNGFNDLITENSTNHIHIEKDDRHLFLEIKIECGELVKSEQAISICTSVKFHNALGRIYFFFIKPFHKLLCRMALNRIIRNRR